MGEHKLCWKCKDYLQAKYGPRFYTAPSNHCHHEEGEEKPKCWCDKHRYYYDFSGGSTKEGVKAIFCPECGKKL